MSKIYLQLIVAFLVVAIGGAVFFSLSQFQKEALTEGEMAYGQLPAQGTTTIALEAESGPSVYDPFPSAGSMSYTLPNYIAPVAPSTISPSIPPTFPTSPSSLAPIDSKKPVITSITPEIITNTSESITITGAHFLPTGNTVIVSSEPLQSFTNIAATTDTNIQFTLHLSMIDVLKKHISDIAVQSSLSYTAVAEAIVANIKLAVDGPPVTKVPITILVRNVNGESNAQTISVDMASVLHK